MYKALISFSGLISMTVGEVREISDQAIVKDLLDAGYIEPVVSVDKTTKKKSAPKKED